MDRPHDFLDRVVALRTHRQAALHAPPTVSGVGGAQGAWRYLDLGDAAQRSPWLPVQPRSVRLAHAMGESLQDYGASVLILVKRRGRRRTGRDDDQKPWRLYERD